MPAAPAAPPKKSRKGLWIAVAIVVALLLCCGCGGGLLVYNQIEEQAKYDAIFEELDSAAARLDELDPSLSPDPQTFVEDARPAIAEFRDAVKKARSDVQALGDSEKKTKAVAALTSLDKALVKLDSVMKGLSNINKLQSDMLAMADDVKRADAAISLTIDHANNKRWGEAEAQVNVGLEAYRAAEAKMAAIEKEWPGVGMESMTSIIAAKRAAAEDAAQLVQYGRQGKTKAYNDTINAYNAHQRDIAAANPPAFVSDPNLLTGNLWDDLKTAITESKSAIKQLEDLQ